MANLEAEKLSDKSSDHQSRDMASRWQPWCKVAGGKILLSSSNLCSHKARKSIGVLYRDQSSQAQGKVERGEGWICGSKGKKQLSQSNGPAIANQIQTLRACYGLNCVFPPPNAYVEALTPSVTVFGERAYGDVIKVE